jgi:hypothetical protein
MYIVLSLSRMCSWANLLRMMSLEASRWGEGQNPVVLCHLQQSWPKLVTLLLTTALPFQGGLEATSWLQSEWRQQQQWWWWWWWGVCQA